MCGLKQNNKDRRWNLIILLSYLIWMIKKIISGSTHDARFDWMSSKDCMRQWSFIQNGIALIVNLCIFSFMPKFYLWYVYDSTNQLYQKPRKRMVTLFSANLMGHVICLLKWSSRGRNGTWNYSHVRKSIAWCTFLIFQIPHAKRNFKCIPTLDGNDGQRLAVWFLPLTIQWWR